MPPQAFETGLARLEEIVKNLEGGELPLERSLALFEEGTRITRGLHSTLEAAEHKIEILLGAEGAQAPRRVSLASAASGDDPGPEDEGDED